MASRVAARERVRGSTKATPGRAAIASNQSGAQPVAADHGDLPVERVREQPFRHGGDDPELEPEQYEKRCQHRRQRRHEAERDAPRVPEVATGEPEGDAPGTWSRPGGGGEAGGDVLRGHGRLTPRTASSADRLRQHGRPPAAEGRSAPADPSRD